MDHIPYINYDDTPPARAAPPPRKPADAVVLPETEDIGDLCRAATPAAIRRLCEIALDDGTSPGMAVQAIKEILDRGYGKSPQTIEHEITLPHIDKVIATLESKLGAIEHDAAVELAAEDVDES